MNQFIFIFLLITLSASFIRPENKNSEKDRFVIWNIGQGQWTTLITKKYCDHFDIGGEFDLSKKVIHICEGRAHRIHISHWDWDHMGLIQKLLQRKISPCLWNIPLGQASTRKKTLLANIPLCEHSDEAAYHLIFLGDSSRKASSNDSSQVVETQGILIPGDSTKKEEKKWSSQTENQAKLSQIKGLILGHHGSHGSTSQILVSHLKNLRWAIATARKKRYGHPHPEVLTRLKKNKTPVLLTEDWGSIIFEL